MLRASGIHVKIVVVDVGATVVINRTGGVVTATAVIELRREDTFRSLRLPGLLDSRQADGRALTEREVRLKQTKHLAIV